MFIYKREPWQVRLPFRQKAQITWNIAWWFLIVPALAYGILFHEIVRGGLVIALWPVAINAVWALATWAIERSKARSGCDVITPH